METNETIAQKAARALEDNPIPRCGGGAPTKQDLDFFYKQGYGQCYKDIMEAPEKLDDTQRLRGAIVGLSLQVEAMSADMRAEHTKAIETSNELHSYKDQTPITDGWLWDNGFSESGWVKVGDNLIRCYETGRARWFASVSNDERNFYEEFGRLKTIGQLKMFLALCGIFDNQLKDFVK